MSESYIQTPPDSTGKKVRNLKVQTYIPDSTTGVLTLTDVYIQAVTITDENGVELGFGTELLMQEVITELKRLRTMLEVVFNMPHANYLG